MIFRDDNGFSCFLRAKEGMIEQNIITVGSPNRVMLAKKFYSKIKYENFNREYHYVLVMFFCGISSPFSEKILQIKML